MTEGYPNVLTMMTPEQLAKVSLPKASESRKVKGWDRGASPYQMTGHFHLAMKMEVPEAPILPTVSQRERRLRLILEEFLELVEAMGFTLTVDAAGVDESGFAANECIGVQHIEGSRYDLVETADALADLNVVVNGTGVEFGIPMELIDYEVYCSNLTKLDGDDNPMVNHCYNCGSNPNNPYLSTCECGTEEAWLKPGVPLGKILKPEGFVPCNIPAVLVSHFNREF